MDFTLHQQAKNMSGTVTMTTTTEARESAKVSFSYDWDIYKKKSLSYTNGRLEIEGKAVASFGCETIGKTVFRFEFMGETDYHKTAEYIAIIVNAFFLSRRQRGKLFRAI